MGISGNQGSQGSNRMRGSVSTIFASKLVKIKEETPNDGKGVAEQAGGSDKWSHCSQKQFDDMYNYS